jgi:hypothetical protein
MHAPAALSTAAPMAPTPPITSQDNAVRFWIDTLSTLARAW